jgi:flagellar biogenesis protein FliO
MPTVTPATETTSTLKPSTENVPEVIAAMQQPAGNPMPPSNADMLTGWGQMLASLLVVCVLALVVLRWLRPWLQQGQQVPLGRRVQVLQSVRLGGGHVLHTVQLGQTTRLLVGTGPHGSPCVLHTQQAPFAD